MVDMHKNAPVIEGGHALSGRLQNERGKGLFVRQAKGERDESHADRKQRTAAFDFSKAAANDC